MAFAVDWMSAERTGEIAFILPTMNMRKMVQTVRLLRIENDMMIVVIST